MESLVNDTMDSLKDYLPKLIEGSNFITDELQSGSESKALQFMPQLFEGIQWVVSAIDAIKKLGVKIRINTKEINDKLLKLEESIKIRDLVYASDLFEYEINPILKDWLEEILRNKS